MNTVQTANTLAETPYGGMGDFRSRAATLPSPPMVETSVLPFSRYPRWAELTHRALAVSPPSFARETPTVLQGVLLLLHEHTLAPWSLTVLEGNPFLAPGSCKENRYHLQHTPQGWDWKQKHKRQHQAAASPLQQLLQPATVADHAQLMRTPKSVLSLYNWGEEGYMAILNMAGVVIGIRDVPGVAEANEILVYRDSFEARSLDCLDVSLLVELFGRDGGSEGHYEKPDSLIDDEQEGATGIPSVFFQPPSSREEKGIIDVVIHHIKQGGKGNEHATWDQFRASDQYRFNQERLRSLIIPGVLEHGCNPLPGSEAADVLLILGLAHRFEEHAKPVDAPGLTSLAELSVKLAAGYLVEQRRLLAENDQKALDARLKLMGQIWIHMTGRVPQWLPGDYGSDLKASLDAFFERIRIKASL